MGTCINYNYIFLLINQVIIFSAISVRRDNDLKLVKSGGISIHDVKATISPRSKSLQSDPILEKYLFIPYTNIKVIYSRHNIYNVNFFLLHKIYSKIFEFIKY